MATFTCRVRIVCAYMHDVRLGDDHRVWVLQVLLAGAQVAAHE